MKHEAMNGNLEKLYNSLRNDYGANFSADYETFANDMKDAGKRNRLYENMRRDYGTNFTKSFDEFSSDIGFGSNVPFYLQRGETAKTPQGTNPPQQPIDQNAAQRQKGFWSTPAGDALEKLGAGLVNTAAGAMTVSEKIPSVGNLLFKKVLDPKIKEKSNIDPETNIDYGKVLQEKGKEISERGDRYGNMIDPKTGEIRKKTYRDLWKEGNYLGALGDVMLTATESAPTSALAMLPGGLGIISLTAAGQKYNEIDSNPETKNLPEWKKLLNASVSGAIEGTTEKIGAKVDLKMIEPFLSKMTETTVKGILKKGGVNALMQTVTEGLEEVLSQVGGNVTDYATGVSDKFKPFEGVGDAFVYGAGGGAQFGGVTMGAAGYRAGQKAIENRKQNAFEKEVSKLTTSKPGETETATDQNINTGWMKALNDQFQSRESVLESVVNPVLPENADLMDVNLYLSSRIGLQQAQQSVDEAMKDSGFKFDKSVLEMPAEQQKQVVRDILQDENTSDQQKQAALNLITASAVDRNLKTAQQEYIASYLERKREYYEDLTNKKTGTVVSGTIKGDENTQDIYIIDGLAITANDDGTLLADLANSDEAVYYKDAGGDMQVTTADNIEVTTSMSVEDHVKPYAEMIANRQSQIEQQVAAYFASPKTTEDGEPVKANFIVGDMAELPDGTVTQIIQINDDGSVLLEVQQPNGSISEAVASADELPKFGFEATPISSLVGEEEATPISSLIGEEEAPPQLTTEEQERAAFMDGLPVVESGKEAGQFDHSKFTPEQNIKFSEYEYGKDETLAAAEQQVANLKQSVQKEEAKLKNNPFDFKQKRKVTDMRAELKAYNDYVFAEKQARTQQQIQEAEPTSILDAQEQQREEIQASEAGRTGSAATSISDKWNNAPKVEGIEDVVTLANGEKITGKYVLTNAGALSPSHNVFANFTKTEGFPTNEHGKTVNDRDYEADQTAQVLVQQRANNYDERAVQTPVVVSNEGIVLSGNDRTMSGQLAARQGTDAAYNDYITRYATRWGFTPEQVQATENPRIVFVPDNAMPYNTQTFAKFNAEEKKTQSSLESAIKASKSISREAIVPLSSVIEQYDKLNDFYNAPQAAKRVIDVLLRHKLIGTNEVPKMMDGDVLSTEGRSFLETMMLGSVLNETALRQVDKMRSIRQTLMRTMPQLLRNAALTDYSLIDELNNAIGLLYESKQNGNRVELQLMQGNLFDASAEEIYSEAEKLLSLMLESEKDTEFRRIFDVYNTRAVEIEAGQTDMFEGVLSKPELLQKILNNYGQRTTDNRQQQEKGVEQIRPAVAVDQRGERATTGDRATATEAGGRAESQSDGEVERGFFGTIYRQFKGKAKEAIAFLIDKKEGEAVGALSHPEIGDIDLVWGEEGTSASDGYGLSKIVKYHPEILDNLQEIINDMVVVSKTDNRIQLESDTHKAAVRLEWNKSSKKWLLTAFKKETPASTISRTDVESNPMGLRNDTATPQNASVSDTKDNTDVSNNQTNTEKNKSDGDILSIANNAVKNAEIKKEGDKVDPSPTDAQKAAGNYKKGHVSVQGFDITIENPKGSVRSGTDEDGKAWETTMQNHYGYFKRTEGKDGDHIDVFVGDNPLSEKIFVVDQNNPQTGSFDESKVMLGFTSADEAKNAYMSNYEPGWQGFGSITETTVEDFKKWLYDSAKQRKAFAEYKENREKASPHDGDRGSIKEPWQMTLDEFNAYEENDVDVTGWYESKEAERVGQLMEQVSELKKSKNKSDHEKARKFEREASKITENWLETHSHRNYVEEAIGAGKVVPDEVLKDYPELKVTNGKNIDVNGNRILTPDEWNALTDEEREPLENTITKVVTNKDGKTFNVDHNLAEPLQRILNAGYQTGQSDSGTISDHPGYRYVEDDVNGKYKKGDPIESGSGAYLTFWLPSARKIVELGGKINSQKQIDAVIKAADKLGIKHMYKDVFFQPSIRLSFDQANDGTAKINLLKEAGELTTKDYPNLYKENFLAWIEKRNNVYLPQVEASHGGMKVWTDEEVIQKWNELANELENNSSNKKITSENINKKLSEQKQDITDNKVNKNNNNDKSLQKSELTENEADQKVKFNGDITAFADQVVEANKKKNSAPVKEDSAPSSYGSDNKIITTERYNELREQLRRKLNNLNVGFDPEIFAIGAQMAMYHIESGANKFADFARKMVSDLGDAVRPYLKAFYEGARNMPGMEDLSRTMDDSGTVKEFDVNGDLEQQHKNNIQNETEQGTRSAEAIAVETTAVETASEAIRGESENVGSDKQRAGQVKDKANEQIERIENLVAEIDDKISNMRLSGKNYSTKGIYADYPITVLAKGEIKRDATKFVKAVARITGFEYDTNPKGKQQIVNVNIAPAGGDVTFILWSKNNPDYGIYVSVPYEPDYGDDGYENYRVRDTQILWRVTTKKDKWGGLSNQWANVDVTAQELAEILMKGLNNHLKSLGLQQNEISKAKDVGQTEKESKLTKKTSRKVAKNQNNMLSLFSEDDLNTTDNERVLQGNSIRLHSGERSESGSGMQRGGTGRDSGLESGKLPGSDGSQQRSAERKRGVLQGNADVLTDAPLPAEPTSVEDTPALVTFNAERNDVETFNKTAKYADNISAIETLLTLLTEKRKSTPAEKSILSKYVGFGGLKEVLLNPDADNWSKTDVKYKEQVRRIIKLAERFDEITGSNDTLNKIRGSILNAHYTSATVIDAVYSGIKKLGFKHGNILEPSAGIGNFITFMPESIKSKSNVSAVELDNLTGNILKAIHDDAHVQISGIENANIPNNSQDLVISNIPFGNYKVYDKSFKGEKSEFQNRIHNYFFAKAIDQAREGGIIAFVTSKGVLDAPGNENIREYLNKNAEFLGAVRLPNNAFEKAANTQVVTDIIFLKKNSSGNNSNQFTKVVEVEAKHRDGATEKVTVNEYFVNHPENLLGDIEAGGLYSRSDYTVNDNGKSADLSKVIRAMLPSNVFTPVQSAAGLQAGMHGSRIEDVKEGNIVYIDGKLYQKNEGKAVEASINEPQQKIEQYIDLRNALMDLIYSEYINANNKEIESKRAKLNKIYDDFIGKYGKLNKSGIKIAKVDGDGYNVLSLEIEGKKADIFSKRTISPIRQRTHAESIDEAIIISLSESASIDMERISQLMGMSIDEVRQQAKGKIFEQPTGGFVTRDEYLSGNVKRKLKEAKQAVEEGFTEFQNNVEELERVIPADIPAVQIEARLGSRWIPASVYSDFAKHIFKSDNIRISYSQGADQYFHNGRLATVEAVSKYGTQRVNGADILLHALHINPPKVFDYIDEGGGKKKAILNQEETDKAIQKYQEIRDLFEDWVYKDEERRTLLSGIYNERFNTNVKRKYDGSHMTVPGISGITLRPHQKDAIWMLLQNGGGVIDHIVGAGKTFVMVAGTMEMKRTGIAKKPMIIALKSTIPQIIESYRSAYPMAKILAPMEKDFKKENRRQLFSKIANNEWDCIIMSHENYGKIPHEKYIQEQLINEELAQLEEERDVFEAENDKNALKGIEIRIKNLTARLEKLSDLDKDNSLTFEQMGIDHIMVDESQQFKNLSYVTKQRGIAGLGNAEGSKRSFNLLTGIRYIQQKLGGDRGTTFLSGTPITNSMVEMYSLLNYLRPNKMKELGFTSFDAWATTFANPTTDIEFTVTNNLKQKTRFREFMNVPELSMLYTEIADIRTDENLKLDKPAMKGGGYTVENIQMNDDQIEFGNRLTEFAKTKDGRLIGRGPLSKDEESAAMLLATNLSSKMAIDMRLIDPSYPYNPNGKIAKVVSNVARIYNETDDFKGTQLIFSDLGTPKNRTNKTALLKDYLEDEIGLNVDTLNELFGDPNVSFYRYPSIWQVRRKMSEVLEMSDEEIERVISESENSVGSSFDIYNEIKSRLIEQGIPAEQIVFIHDYNTNNKKEALFKKVNKGNIRIVLGSTQKLGTGVNVQKKVVAVHHVDVPWTPASMEQRNGRAIRQGNLAAKEHLNNELPIYAYATERTLDAYKYQLLYTKQRFLNQVKSGEVEDRVLKEGDGDSESGVGYAELVAMLSGNQDILLKSKLEEKVNRLKRQKRNFEGELYEAVENKRKIEERIPEIEANINKSKQAITEITDKAQLDDAGKLVVDSFNGKTFKDTKDDKARIQAAKAAIEYVDKRMKQMDFGDKERFSMGAYNFEFTVVKAGEEGIFATSKKPVVRIMASNGASYVTNISTVAGVFLNNIQKTVTEQVPYVLNQQEKLLEREKKSLSSYTEIIERGDHWSKQEEYDQTVAELKEVTARLDAETKANSDNKADTTPTEAEEAAPVYSGQPIADFATEVTQYNQDRDIVEVQEEEVKDSKDVEDKSGELVQIVKAKNTKTGDDMFLVKINRQLDYDTEYKKIAEPLFKKLGGYWSRFNKSITFKSEKAADEFAREIAKAFETSDEVRFMVKSNNSERRPLKMNTEVFKQLTEAFNNATTLDEKAAAAESIIRGIERVIGDDFSYVATTHEDMIRLVPGLTAEEKSDIRAGKVQGLFDGTTVNLDVESIDTVDDLIHTWFHENGHRLIKKLFTKEQLVTLYDKIKQTEEVKELLDYYKNKSKEVQAEEIINAAVEFVVSNNSLEDVANNTINYDMIPKQLRKFVEPIFNQLHDEQLQKNKRDPWGIRETGLPSNANESNRGGISGNNQTNERVSENNGQGDDFQRRARGYRSPGVEENAQTEREAIKSQAKADGTWMKAPNGAPTNLTEEQWVTVRTKAFKNWFGDWETSWKAEQILNGSPVSELSGEEFAKSDVSIIDQVSEFFNSIGGKVEVKGIGEVGLTKQSVRDSISHGLGRNKAVAFKAIPEILVQGQIIDRQTNWKGRGYNSYTISAPITIAGERFVAVAIVNEAKSEGVHKFYLHEVVLQKSLQSEEFKTGMVTRSPQGDITNILRKIVTAKENVSKVVDDNGEPLVVYHGTPDGSFNIFSENLKGTRTKHGPEDVGFHFTNNKEYAKGFSLEYKKDYYKNLIDVFGYIPKTSLAPKNAKTYSVFLNIKNPHIIDNAKIDRNIINRSKEKSNDGIFASIGDIKEYVAFSPNQIKSATDNVGTFDAENNDIRFSVKDKPKYKGQPIADFAKAVNEYNQRDEVRFSVNPPSIPTPPVLNAGMSLQEIADAVALFKNRTDEVFRDVNKEMAKISNLYTAFIDRARPLEKILSLMKDKGAKINSDTDAYMDYISSASRSTHLIQEYEKTRIEPLQKTLKEVVKNLKTLGKNKEIGDYRWNIVDEQTGDVINDKAISDYDRVSLYLQAKDIVEADGLQGVAARGAQGFENNVRDAFGNGIKPQDYIDEFENAVGKQTIDDIWEKVRDVNRWALDLQYKFGLIERSVYDEYTSGARMFYVPQRGWRERDLNDSKLYYVTSTDETPDNPYNAALVKAKGRQTLAGDPLAYMQSIGESSVMAAMKNRTKQKFLQFAEDNADFARVHDFFGFKQVYYVATGVRNEDGYMTYERTYEPPLKENIDNDMIIRKELKQLSEVRMQAQENYNSGRLKAAAYNRLMGRLAEKEKALQNNILVKYTDSEAQRIAQVTAKERRQHSVIIIKNGKEYEIIFSKNYDGERIANVLNRNFGKEVDGDLKFMQQINENTRRLTRFMSAMMTQYNPAFAVTNAIRDYGIASISNLTERGIPYQMQFQKNLFAVQRAVWRYASAEQFKTGKGIKNENASKYDVYLREFFEDGAATGWSFLKDIETLRTNMKRAIDPKTRDYLLNGQMGIYNAFGLKQVFGMLTEVSELTTRLAAYVTSREQKTEDGKQKYTRMEASIHAKEISVNFDRKGNQKFFGTLFSFFNASIQGTNKLFRMIRDPRVRAMMAATSATLVAGGLLQALLMPDPDDDDERMFTEWELMNNVCVGKIKFPLPQGLRAFWGIGTQAGLAGRGMKSAANSVVDGTKFFFGEVIPEQLVFWMNGIEIDDKTEKLSYNPTLTVRGAVPTMLQPLYDVWQNTNFMGGTSYRTEFTNTTQNTKSERTMGKRNVSDAAQDVSNWLWTLGGGDLTDGSRLKKADTGVVSAIFDVNPSVIETLTRGYAAGTGKFVMDMWTLADQIFDPSKKVDVSRMAIANVLWKQPREYSALDSKLWTLRDKASFYKTQFGEIKKNNPDRYQRIVSFHTGESGALRRENPEEFNHQLKLYGTKENKMFDLVNRSEQLQKQIDANVIGGKQAEQQVEMLLEEFRELQ